MVMIIEDPVALISAKTKKIVIQNKINSNMIINRLQ